MRLHVGFTYYSRDDYLVLGYDEETCAELARPETIATIRTTLESFGHTVEPIGGADALSRRLLADERWDLVFNIAEGLSGLARESLVPALLDARRIPYTFADAATMALTLHKAMAKRVVRDCGVPTPAFALVESLDDLDGLDLPFPLFAKPVAEGSSKGVTRASLARDEASLRAVCAALLERFSQPVLVEAYLPGRELTVGILGSGARSEVLGVMEVLLREGAEQEAYSRHNKEHPEGQVGYRLCEDAVAERAAAVALAAWRGLGCRDAGRVDLRLDAAGQPSVGEANALPGLHPVRSDLAIMAWLRGISYRDLIESILSEALERAGRRARPPRLQAA